LGGTLSAFCFVRGRREDRFGFVLSGCAVTRFDIRMHDSEVVAAIVAGDPDGLAEAYDRYAAPLYTYCRSLLREPADAADAVQDTFVIAAVRGLGASEQDLIRLQLQQELDVAEIAAVLGVSRNHAHALLSRARAQLEVSLGALLVARSGRGDCEALGALLEDWDGQLNVLMRKRAEHDGECQRQRRAPGPGQFRPDRRRGLRGLPAHRQPRRHRGLGRHRDRRQPEFTPAELGQRGHRAPCRPASELSRCA
jgi:hypothetical protein